MINFPPHEAEIIAFPLRPVLTPADPGQERLAAALAKLVRALDEQQVAVREWRASLGELKQSVEKLGDSVGEYRANLTGLAFGVDQLNQQAHTLALITEAF